MALTRIIIIAGLNVDLSVPGSIFADIGDSSDEHAHHHHEHQNHFKSLPPAGVMFGHMMQKSNAVVGHDTVSTVNYPQNTGGHYWDIGLGVRLSPSQGILNGHTVSFEWLQPVSDVVNGYQLERTGAFSTTWTYMF